eukprot:1312737-Ditylum_brightwellii.AAC.1
MEQDFLGKAEMEQEISMLSSCQMSDFAEGLAREIKERYSICLSEDKSELYFILVALGLLWMIILAIGFA